jgi:hypothetical protein
MLVVIAKLMIPFVSWPCLSSCGQLFSMYWHRSLLHRTRTIFINLKMDLQQAEQASQSQISWSYD